jgi:hypothetical protein
MAATPLQFAASTLAPKLKRARQVVEAAKAEAAALRAKLALKAADKTDAAGQMRRLWKLDKFNAMPDAERNSYLAKNIDNLDPELAQAFLEAPEYSKIMPSDLHQIRERALTAQHGAEAIAEIQELEAGIAIADDVVAVSREEIAQDVGGLAKFDAAAEPFERAASAPWLRKALKDGAEVVQVFARFGQGKFDYTWREATPQVIEQGMFFPTAAEWQQAGGAFPTMEQANGNARA